MDPIRQRRRLIITLAINGVFPHTFLAFTALDVGLAIGALMIRGSHDVIAARPSNAT